MKVVVNAGFEKYWESEFDKIESEFKDVNFIFTRSKLDTEKELKDADVFIGGYLTDEEINNSRNLKVVFVPWAGVDILPVESIVKKGIVVSNSHGNARIVAERAFSLALSLLGKIPQYHNDLQKGIWHGFSVGFKEEDLWESMWNKKCSILGLGTIGRYLAKLLKAFDCEVIGFKREITKIDNVDYVTNDLSEAVEKSEIIFVILPLTKHTQGIIDWDIISKMKGKFLINVGRGAVIDEKALYKGLKNNILAGSAIDVWYNYPSKDKKIALPSKYPIHTFDNVVISPHVGGYSIEGQVRRIKDTCESLIQFIKTGVPTNIVNLELGY
jgi:phosphoglycerate dehydrogenase-like enzyme